MKVALHPEVSVTVQVNVARSADEAELQAQGIDVMAQMFERDTAPAPEELTPVAATEETEAGGEAGAEREAAAEAEPEAASGDEAQTAEDGEEQA